MNCTQGPKNFHDVGLAHMSPCPKTPLPYTNPYPNPEPYPKWSKLAQTSHKLGSLSGKNEYIVSQPCLLQRGCNAQEGDSNL